MEIDCEAGSDPVVLFHLLRFYLDNPDLRRELGTPASVERVRRRHLLGVR